MASLPALLAILIPQQVIPVASSAGASLGFRSLGALAPTVLPSVKC